MDAIAAVVLVLVVAVGSCGGGPVPGLSASRRRL